MSTYRLGELFARLRKPHTSCFLEHMYSRHALFCRDPLATRSDAAALLPDWGFAVDARWLRRHAAVGAARRVAELCAAVCQQAGAVEASDGL